MYVLNRLLGVYILDKVIWVYMHDLVSLFIGKSTSVGYLIPKPSFQKAAIYAWRSDVGM